jgi:hypothetical protein
VPDYTLPEFTGLIGVGREEITPPAGIYARNWGAAQHDAAEGIHRPLTVTALTFQRDAAEPPMILIAADLGWWKSAVEERAVRQGVLDALGLDEARLMICLSHTHAAPVLCLEDADRPGGQFIAPYLEHLREALIRAARQALASRQPAVLTWSYGRCSLAANRDLRDPERPRYLSGFCPNAPADDTLLVGRVAAISGAQVVATLVNYACHPTTLAWQNRLISPDFVGAMREVVEAQTGSALCLYLHGASGELAPREQYTADTAIADANGRQLGYAALSVLAGMLPPQTKLTYTGVMESGAPLAVWSRAPRPASPALEALRVEVTLPRKPWPSLAELDAELAGCADRAFAERIVRKRRIQATLGEGTTAPMPLWAWRIGEAVLVGISNEAYSRLQTALRQHFSDRAVAVMNVVNGHFGYLPPEALYTEDLYPVWQTPFDRGSLERVIVAAEEAIRRLF